MDTDGVVIVTGITGYIGTHVAKVLADNGYKVRGTVRSLENARKTDQIRELFKDSKHPLELVEADLTKDEGWESAMEGCTALMHVASPFPNVAEHSVKEEDVVKPAIDGTLRAIKAAVKAKIKKIILTSSCVSICADATYDVEKVFTEEDWTNLEDSTVDVYSKSKTLAEKAAWDYLKELPDEDKFEMAVVNPSFVMGPVLLESHKGATSVNTMVQLLNKTYPAHPRMAMGYCDVRDVANAHYKALITPEAYGHRHIIFTEALWLKDFATMVADEFRPQGYSIATSEIPYFVCWVYGTINKGMRSYILPRYGKTTYKLDNTRMKEVLGITPTPIKSAAVEMAYSLIELGIVKKTKKCKLNKYDEVSPEQTEDKPESTEEAKSEPETKDSENTTEPEKKPATEQTPEN